MNLIKVIFLFNFLIGVSSHAKDFHSVCDRSSAVTMILVKTLNKPCEQITPVDLASVKELFFPQDGSPWSLQTNDFQGLIKLENLFLSGTNLQSLPPGVFDGLEKVEYISLCRNKLTSLPDTLFRNLPSLSGVCLFGNYFNTLPVDLLLNLNLTDLVVDFTPTSTEFFKPVASARLEYLQLMAPDCSLIPKGFKNSFHPNTYIIINLEPIGGDVDTDEECPVP